MTWLRYAGDNYQPDINIRLEDVVGITVGRSTGVYYSVTVFYSDGQQMDVGTFSSPAGNDDPMSRAGYELAVERAEEIKRAVDEVRA